MSKEAVNNYYLEQFDISSVFGENRGSYSHKGVDFNLAGNKDLGMSILSVADGVIEKVAYQDKGAGNYVTVRHKDGSSSTYMHMQNKSPLAVGTSVKAGQEIGKIGNTGESSGSHLHLQMEDSKGKLIDPVAWLKGKVIKATGGTSESVKTSDSVGGSDGFKGIAEDLLERFRTFSWNAVPFLLGLVILLLTIYSMFLPTNLLKKVIK